MTNQIVACDLPETALLQPYRNISGGFTDCYRVDGPPSVSLAAYVQAFYTTPLFRVERWILSLAARAPSTDAQAAQLAAGQIDRFAVWRVEDRAQEQLLMRENSGRTRSWFMIARESESLTRLYFGSAVVPVDDRKGGPAKMGWMFHALLGFHGLYSRALLAAARRRLMWPQKDETQGQTIR